MIVHMAQSASDSYTLYTNEDFQHECFVAAQRAAYTVLAEPVSDPDASYPALRRLYAQQVLGLTNQNDDTRKKTVSAITAQLAVREDITGSSTQDNLQDTLTGMWDVLSGAAPYKDRR